MHTYYKTQALGFYIKRKTKTKCFPIIITMKYDGWVLSFIIAGQLYLLVEGQASTIK